MNSQKGFIVPLIIIIIAIVATAGGYFVVKSNISKNTEPLHNAINVTNGVVADTGSTTPKNQDVCSSALRGHDKDTCFYTYAQSKVSTEYCAKIEDDTNKNGCIGLIALKTSNAAVCDGIKPTTNYKAMTVSSCYSFVAIKTKNVALCEKIIDASIKKACIDNVAPQKVQKPIEITSPSAGQTFKRGDTMTISWKGGAKSIHVGVVPTTGSKKGIVQWISNNSQPNNSVTWNVKTACTLYPDMSKCIDIEAGTYNVYIVDIETPTSYSFVKIDNKDVTDTVKDIIIQ